MLVIMSVGGNLQVRGETSVETYALEHWWKHYCQGENTSTLSVWNDDDQNP